MKISPDHIVLTAHKFNGDTDELTLTDYLDILTIRVSYLEKMLKVKESDILASVQKI